MKNYTIVGLAVLLGFMSPRCFPVEPAKADGSHDREILQELQKQTRILEDIRRNR